MMVSAISPGGCVGIVGGGQLGRMLALSAARLGLDTHVFSDERDSPAGRVSALHTCAEYEDEAALCRFAEACDVVTYEFENIPPPALRVIEGCGVAVRPGVKALEIARDRLEEKRFLSGLDLPVAAFAPVRTDKEFQQALEQLGRGFIKTRWSGYDGRGQMPCVPGDDPGPVFEWLSGREAVFEAHVPFAFEISVLLVRDLRGEVVLYDIPKNTHENGILVRSEAPAGLEVELSAKVQAGARRLAEALDHVGMLALEVFVGSGGEWVANEFSPRVHNSGHWTEAACISGQFEQHIRAVCGWPLGDVRRLSDIRMENLLGHDVDGVELKGCSGSVLHLYGKNPVRAGRKMGHVTHLLRSAAGS